MRGGEKGVRKKKEYQKSLHEVLFYLSKIKSKGCYRTVLIKEVCKENFLQKMLLLPLHWQLSSQQKYIQFHIVIVL